MTEETIMTRDEALAAIRAHTTLSDEDIINWSLGVLAWVLDESENKDRVIASLNPKTGEFKAFELFEAIDDTVEGLDEANYDDGADPEQTRLFNQRIMKTLERRRGSLGAMIDRDMEDARALYLQGKLPETGHMFSFMYHAFKAEDEKNGITRYADGTISPKSCPTCGTDLGRGVACERPDCALTVRGAQ